MHSTSLANGRYVPQGDLSDMGRAVQRVRMHVARESFPLDRDGIDPEQEEWLRDLIARRTEEKEELAPARLTRPA